MLFSCAFLFQLAAVASAHLPSFLFRLQFPLIEFDHRILGHYLVNSRPSIEKNKAMHTLHFISLLLCFMLSKWGVSCASFSCVLLELIKHACLFLSFACTHARCQQA